MQNAAARPHTTYTETQHESLQSALMPLACAAKGLSTTRQQITRCLLMKLIFLEVLCNPVRSHPVGTKSHTQNVKLSQILNFNL